MVFARPVFDRCYSSLNWAILRVPFGTVSAIDVSSTYFQMGTFGTLRSLIISKKSQGPRLFPWGTPEGTDPQSEKQALESFTRFEPAGNIQTR